MTDPLLDLPLRDADPELADLLDAELGRQRSTLDLVASESIPPRAILEAQGSVLTAKYADGYPGRRDYDTCEWIDEIETLAIKRAKSLFSAEHANVQPYSGSNANMAVLHGLCRPGEAVLGFDFNHGGHPTHYDESTFAGRCYDAHAYGVRREDRLVDMDQVASMAEQLRPRVIFAGWSCYPRLLDFAAFREIADGVGARLVVDMAHFAGLVAAGLHPDPVPYADVCTMTVHKTLGGARGGAILCREELARAIDDAVYPGTHGCPLPHVLAAKAATFALARTESYRERMARTVAGARMIASVLVESAEGVGAEVVTGGTDVHQLLVDLGPSGRRAAAVLAKLNEIGVSANDIRIAYDAQDPPAASGLRFGATALAARGFGEDEFRQVGSLLAEALGSCRRDDGRDWAAAAPRLRAKVTELLEPFPLYRFLP